jgi:hypothetical protein
MRRFAAVALLSVLAASPLRAQSRLATTVDTTVVTVGDRLTMTVSVDHPAGSSAELPDSLALAPFEVLGVEPLPGEAVGDGVRSGWKLTLTAFELGDLEIPSFPVTVVGGDASVDSLSTDPYGIRVESVGADETGDIRDIRGPLGIPMARWILAMWLVLPWLALSVLYFLAKRLRPRGKDVPRPALGELARPAHEVAIEALEALERSGLLERGQVKEYHIAASDILRTYVEARFRVEALEMTTREVLDGLGRVGAGSRFLEGLRTFLEACDLVKFAKARPDVAASRATTALGVELVRESAAVPAAASPDTATVGAEEAS